MTGQRLDPPATHKDGRDCVMVVYRNTLPGKIDLDTNRRYGETGQSETDQLEADRKWWSIAADRRPRLRGIVYVADGVVVRIREVLKDGTWRQDHRGYVNVPLSGPLTPAQATERFPTLPIHLGTPRPHVRGKIREYITL